MKGSKNNLNIQDTWICKYCNNRVPNYDDSHHYTCKGQRIVKCPKGHDIGELMLRAEGCGKCEHEVWIQEAKKFYCPKCGDKGKSKPENADEDYEGLRCECGIYYRIYSPIENPDEDGEEPRETYDPGYASEQYRKMIESRNKEM